MARLFRRSRSRLMTFLAGVRQELAQVVWPSRSEVMVYSLVVVLTVVVLGAFILVVDYGISRL